MACEATFSAIITTHNRKDYLLQAVQSVVEQTYPAHEIIVVVDGSTDGSAAAVRGRFPAVRVIEQPNLGRSIARNTGVAVASGEWVAFLDDDDLWHREKLLKTVAYLTASPGCGAVNTWFWCFSAPAMECEAHFTAESVAECHSAASSCAPDPRDMSYLVVLGKSFESLLQRNCGAFSYSAIRREIFIRAGGLPPAQTCDEDRLLFLNVSRLTEWHTIRERLGFSRQHPAQDTRSGANSLKILCGLASSWYGGRPLPHAADESEVRRAMLRCAPEYRRLAQRSLWDSLYNGDIRAARAVRRLGWLLLPRFRDRLYASIPPQITWRFERYVLGMHK